MTFIIVCEKKIGKKNDYMYTVCAAELDLRPLRVAEDVPQRVLKLAVVLQDGVDQRAHAAAARRTRASY